MDSEDRGTEKKTLREPDRLHTATILPSSPRYLGPRWLTFFQQMFGNNVPLNLITSFDDLGRLRIT